MKKPGKWIATFGPSLRVSRVNVEASTALDLVEVTTVGEGQQLTNIFYFDRLEAGELVKELQGALDQLEEAAINGSEDPVGEPPRWEVGFASTSGGRLWVPIEAETGQPLAGYTPQVDGAVVEQEVERLNSAPKLATDHPPRRVAGP